MNCPYCGTLGIARNVELYIDGAVEHWMCVKCPNPVTFSVNDKKVSIWVLYNECWYNISYMKTLKKYIVMKESFDLRINTEEAREEYAYNGSIVIQLPSEENVTPKNAPEKLALWLTFE